MGLHLFPWRQSAIATETPPEIQESGDSKAVTLYNSGRYREAIALWQMALKQAQEPKTTALLHTNLGTAYKQIGNLGEAITAWKRAAEIYRTLDDRESSRWISQLQTEQAQAHNALGQFRVALPLLQSAIELAQKNQDPAVEVAARGVLGNTYQGMGELNEAIASHQAALAIAAKLGNPNLTTNVWNNLANATNKRYQEYLFQANAAGREGDTREESRLLALAEGDAKTAREAYERSVQESKAVGGILHAKALLNTIRFWQQLPTPPASEIASYQQQVVKLLENLPDSHAKVNALINLAETLDFSQPLKLSTLEKAIAVARNIGDRRTESFALGALGRVYKQTGNLAKAMELTQQAQFTAQQVFAADSLYRWQAQAGRIYAATGKTELALKSYRQAIATLQTIRGDLAAASKDVQFDLRDSVEPIYRELMALLLADGNAGIKSQSKAQNSASETAKSNIEEALKISELLQLSELQNFFGDECIQIARSSNSNSGKDAANSNTAVIQSIVLDRQTYMVLRLPDGTMKKYSVAVSQQELEKEIARLRFTLENIATDEYLAESQKVYDLLLRPMAADLEKAAPKTLLFVNDGVLRNVPMAALHDGKQFAIEKYAIANTLGLNFTPSKQSASNIESKALIFGLSKEVPPFAPLPNVPKETEMIRDIVGGKSFLDNDFTLSNLQKQIKSNSYKIIHLATHGKFGADPNNTFLQLIDRRLSLPEFEEVLHQSKEAIDLLTLSACQTAAGDSRATLGIAGVALRAGVKSSLASLWFVNDADTVPLMKDFYGNMQKPEITKAEALRQAQLKVIADPNGHPAIWSPFVLVGNWQ